jgi:hypothetical protein
LGGSGDEAGVNLFQGQASLGVVVDRFGLGAEGAATAGAAEAGNLPVGERGIGAEVVKPVGWGINVIGAIRIGAVGGNRHGNLRETGYGG